ncbi:MAG: hypothetical protein KDD22_07275 [Bdellovibrionales bacterium]|nr:hypothetical protein [Bdellovibrionales bacterium]
MLNQVAKRLAVAALLGSLVLPFAGCLESDTENAAEDVGEKMEETAKDAGDAVQDAADDVGDAVEDAAE